MAVNTLNEIYKGVIASGELSEKKTAEIDDAEALPHKHELQGITA